MEDKIQNISTNANGRMYYYRSNGCKKLVTQHQKLKAIVWEAKMQDLFGGSALYKQVLTDSVNRSEWKSKEWDPKSGWDLYEGIYHDLFRALFVPSPPVLKIVQEKMESGHLVPGMYSMAHYRAFYAIEDRKKRRSLSQLKRMAIHALECAFQLRPGVPVYFASDSKMAVDAVREYAQKETNQRRSIVTFSEEVEKDALHIDKPIDIESSPSDYYSTFVDLLLMANGRCLTYGQGGFGLYAALLSYDAKCVRRHATKKKVLNCTILNKETELEDD
jgi:hypothetical protein